MKLKCPECGNETAFSLEHTVWLKLADDDHETIDENQLGAYPMAAYGMDPGDCYRCDQCLYADYDVVFQEKEEEPLAMAAADSQTATDRSHIALKPGDGQ